MKLRQRIGPPRGPQFLLDDRAARHIEAFLNQARLVLVGCLLALGYLDLLSSQNSDLMPAIALGGITWVVIVALLTHYWYRPWVAIAIALVDTLLVSLLIYYTGGPTTPLDALYSILIFAAAIRFTRIHSLLLTLAVILAYVEVTWFHPSFSLSANGNALAVSSIMLAATGVLAWLVSAEVARQRRAIVEAKTRLTGLTLISDIVERFRDADDFETIYGTAIGLVAELIDPCSVTVAEPPRSESSTEPQRGVRVERCAEVLAIPIGPAERPRAWLYVGTDESRPLSTTDRALIQRIAEEAGTALERNALLERERERSASLARLAEENRRLLEVERETVARFRQLSAHKEGFIEMIAHELRTPLTSVKGFAQLLLRAPSPHKGQRYVEMILGESNRLMRIIDDIVDLSRMERGLLEMRRERFELGAVLQKAASELESNGIRPRIEIAGELPALRGDSDKLCQTLVNLVHTGALYHRGTEPMVLTARPEDRGVGLTLDVAGNIPEHRLAHVFDRLPTGAEPTPTELRLYIARNFVEAHGGTLRLETGPERGRLVLSLPAADTTSTVVSRNRAHPGARHRSRSGGQAHG